MVLLDRHWLWDILMKLLLRVRGPIFGDEGWDISEVRSALFVVITTLPHKSGSHLSSRIWISVSNSNSISPITNISPKRIVETLMFGTPGLFKDPNLILRDATRSVTSITDAYTRKYSLYSTGVFVSRAGHHTKND